MINQELPFIFWIENVSDSLGIHKTSNPVALVHCHVLISQGPQDFFLPSAQFFLRKSHSPSQQDGNDQAQTELSLLAIFPESTRPCDGNVTRSLPLCPKVIQKASVSFQPDSSCMAILSPEEKVPS